MEFDKSLAEILDKHIQQTFGTIYNMSKSTGIPYMTISTVLKKGVENSLVRTIYRICSSLDISIESLYFEQFYDTINNKFSDNDTAMKEIETIWESYPTTKQVNAALEQYLEQHNINTHD